jgi:uncharacterized protein YpuA (DUF1002 family)
MDKLHFDIFNLVTQSILKEAGETNKNEVMTEIKKELQKQKETTEKE